MNLATTLLNVGPLVALCAAAAVVDARTRRIPNALTLAVAASGLAQAALWGTPTSPLMSAAGLVVGGGILLIPFALRAIGGGDLKLLAGIGAWLGPVAAVQVYALSAVAGLVIVLAQCAATGRLRQLFRNSAVLATALASAPTLGVDHVERTGTTLKSVDRPMPYAVPILLGVLAVLAWG